MIRAEAHAQDKYAATESRSRASRSVCAGPRTGGGPPTPASTVVVGPAADDGCRRRSPWPGRGRRSPTTQTVWEEGPIVVRLKEHVAQPDDRGAGGGVARAGRATTSTCSATPTPGAASVVYHRRGYSYGLLRLDGGTDG